MIKVIFRYLYLYLFVDMLSFGWNSPYVFFIFCSLPQKYTFIFRSQRLFLNFFVHERESEQRGGDNELQSSKERRKTSGARVTKILYQKSINLL